MASSTASSSSASCSSATATVGDGFHLGMDGWSDPESEPPPKRKRLSLKRKQSEPRWDYLTFDEEMALSEKCVPKNTATSTKWAVANFESWRKRRNERFDAEREKQVPDNLLLGGDSIALCKWLSVYVAEARKRDGSIFPPKSLYMLLTGLLRYIRSKTPTCPNFLDTSELQFVGLHNAMDNVFRKLRVGGASIESKCTETFSKEEIDQLWLSGALSAETPKGLLRAVFFQNGKSFCLRGGEEHRSLKLSQLKRENNPSRYIYTEFASKNRAGGLAQLRVKNKSVSISAVPQAGCRCHVHILDLYFSKLPKESFRRDNFYLQPVSNVKKPNQPWFTTSPVGKNALAKMVKDICADAGVGGSKSNHSLRATGATELYQAGVPEKVIQERTGHLSLTGLRQYERTSVQQHEAASHVLAAKENVTYQQQLSVQSHIAMPFQAPCYSFAHCNVTFNTLPQVSSALTDATNSHKN